MVLDCQERKSEPVQPGFHLNSFPLACIVRKLELHSVTELVRYAIHNKIVESRGIYLDRLGPKFPSRSRPPVLPLMGRELYQPDDSPLRRAGRGGLAQGAAGAKKNCEIGVGFSFAALSVFRLRRAEAASAVWIPHWHSEHHPMWS